VILAVGEAALVAVIVIPVVVYIIASPSLASLPYQTFQIVEIWLIHYWVRIGLYHIWIDQG
jgi:hypothetical protein